MIHFCGHMQQALGRNLTLFQKEKREFRRFEWKKKRGKKGGSQILGWMHARGGGCHSDVYCVQLGGGSKNRGKNAYVNNGRPPRGVLWTSHCPSVILILIFPTEESYTIQLVILI